MAKYYRYIIEEIKTGNRRGIVTKDKRPIAPAGWKIIACCGYHEKEI